MHPIFAQIRRLILYLIAWIPIAALVAYLLAASSGLTRVEALVVAVPLCLIYAFICLSAYYQCRTSPVDKSSDVRLVVTHLSGAIVAVLIWTIVAKVLVIELAQTSPFHGIDRRFVGAGAPLVGTGVLLYLLSVMSYYVYIAVTASHEAEARAIVAQVLARDAELKALKAQVNPHFLFNSLNSISALTSSDPAKAREMCILLGDFLRRTLGLGAKTAIPLEEELSLIHSFVAVEKIRFGARLNMEENIDPASLGFLVPPLLLQPLVENAVVHGIANLIDGGWIRLDVASVEGLLSVTVENQFDPEAPARHRNGVGLANVKQRLQTRYGNRASVDVSASGESFRVALTMPAEVAEQQAGAFSNRAGKESGRVNAEAQKKIRALIVDDEELARQVLREFLGSHPEIELIAECANGFEAVKTVAEQKPDLVFLDIQMPKLDGFEVLELIGRDATVVFVTAHDNYAIRAFEVHAVDYLLKPVAAPRFDAALERAKARICGKAQPAQVSATTLAASARPPAHYLDRIPVRDGTRVFIVPVAKLDYVEAQDDYVALACEGKKHLKQQTIASLEEGLDPARFLRIHRSYIVNLERVARVEPYTKDSHVVILSNGGQLPVSRAGYARLREFLDR